MISPKLAILMATLAVVGAGAIPMAPMALAQDQDADVDIERNNSIKQSIKQSQEACTNEAEVEIDDEDFVDIGGDNEATVGQANVCDVVQAQVAENAAAIEDSSSNTFDIEQFLISLGLDD